MSGSIETGSKGRKKSQDFELNITSIIDCFTVLITFMLVAASFVSIGILDAGIGAAGTNTVSSELNPYLLTINILRDKKININVTGRSKYKLSLSSKNQELDLANLAQNLAELKKKWPEINSAVLMAENSVEYQDVVKSMESVRASISVVLLGGF